MTPAKRAPSRRRKHAKAVSLIGALLAALWALTRPSAEVKAVVKSVCEFVLERSVPVEPLPNQWRAPCPKYSTEINNGCWITIRQADGGKPPNRPDGTLDCADYWIAFSECWAPLPRKPSPNSGITEVGTWR